MSTASDLIEYDENNDTHVKIFDIIESRLNIKRENIKMHLAFITEMGADSLDIVELILQIEEIFFQFFFPQTRSILPFDLAGRTPCTASA